MREGREYARYAGRQGEGESELGTPGLWTGEEPQLVLMDTVVWPAVINHVVIFLCQCLWYGGTFSGCVMKSQGMGETGERLNLYTQEGRADSYGQQLNMMRRCLGLCLCISREILHVILLLSNGNHSELLKWDNWVAVKVDKAMLHLGDMCL